VNRGASSLAFGFLLRPIGCSSPRSHAFGGTLLRKSRGLLVVWGRDPAAVRIAAMSIEPSASAVAHSAFRGIMQMVVSSEGRATPREH